MRRPLLVLSLLGCAAAAACSSTDISGATYMSDVGGAGGTAGVGASSAGGATSSSSDASSSQASSSSASSSSSSTSSSSSSSSTSSSSSSSTSSGSGCTYTAPNTCDGAVELTSVNGDKGSDVRTVTGTTSKWFKVHINEASNLSHGLSYTATLQPASGADFDLFIYDGNADQPNCFAAVKHATGVPESYSDSWGDSLGSEDGRWITLEVRHVGGTGCGASAQWTLTVKGNT